jgi:hypothetical protein
VTHRALCRALATLVAAVGAHLAVDSGGHHGAVHAVDQFAGDRISVAEQRVSAVVGQALHVMSVQLGLIACAGLSV